MSRQRLPEDQLALIIAWQDLGDLRARDALLQSCIGLVHRVIATRFSGWRLDKEDLMQEGLIGAFLAMDAFDRTQGKKFSTFAWDRIRSAIGHYVQRQAGGDVSIKSGARLSYNIGKVKQALESGESLDAVAAGVNLSPSMIAAALPHISYGQRSLDEESMKAVANQLTDTTMRPDDTVELARLLDRVHHLPGRTRDMAEAWLLGGDSFEEIGQRHDMTRQCVRKLIRACLEGVTDSLED